MAYDCSTFEKRVDEVLAWLGTEYMQLQTGRISPGVLDSVKVEAYGTKNPVSHLATVSIEGSKTLNVVAFDETTASAIESALRTQLSGFSIAAAGSSIRVIAPDLTTERREILAKVVKEKREEAKKSLRPDREKVLDMIKADLSSKTLSEDAARAAKEDLQKVVDRANEKIEEAAAAKEKQVRE